MKTLLLIATLTLSITSFAGATNDTSSEDMNCGASFDFTSGTQTAGSVVQDS